MLGEFLEKNCPDVSVKIVIKHTADWTEFIDSVSLTLSPLTILLNRHAGRLVSTKEHAPSFSQSRDNSSVMGLTSSNTSVTATVKFSV